MCRIKYAFIIMLIFFCAACAGTGRFLWPENQEAALFSSADQQYQMGNYKQALILYQQYLTQYPDSGRVPEALFKTGMIHFHFKRYKQALKNFDRVQKVYPDSAYAREAGIFRLDIYYQRRDYSRITAEANDTLASALSSEQRLRVNLLVGDSYLALELTKDAYFAYLRAYQSASADEKKTVLPRLKASIAELSLADREDAIEQLNGRPPVGYLMFQQGKALMDAGNMADAVKAFSSFLKIYPDHEKAKDAEKFISDLQSQGLPEQPVIGCLLPMSGKYAKFGHQALEGIEFALTMFSKQMQRPPIRLIVKDTASDPLIAQQGVEALAQYPVSAIIGPIATAEAAAVKAQKCGIPIIVLTQKPGIPETGDSIFRNFLTPQMQMQALVDYAATVLKMKKFAILYPNESYGEIYMNLFWDAVMASGGKIVGVEAYDPTKTHFADPIKKIVGIYYDIPEDLIAESSQIPLAFIESPEPESQDMAPDVSDLVSIQIFGNWYDTLNASIQVKQRIADLKAEEEGPDPIIDCDAVFIPDSPDKAGLLIPQLAYYDVNNVHLLGTNLWHSEKLIHMAKYYIQGAILPEGFFEQSTAAHVNRFVTGFRYIYGHTPGFIEAVSYDTAWILFDLASRSNIHFNTQLKNELLAMMPFKGVTGMTRFDNTGEAIKDIYLLKIKGQKFLEIAKKKPRFLKYENN